MPCTMPSNVSSYTCTVISSRASHHHASRTARLYCPSRVACTAHHPHALFLSKHRRATFWLSSVTSTKNIVSVVLASYWVLARESQDLPCTTVGVPSIRAWRSALQHLTCHFGCTVTAQPLRPADALHAWMCCCLEWAGRWA
jgi:hypothetical protein